MNSSGTAVATRVESSAPQSGARLSSRKRVAVLDGLRALSIAFVLLGHASGTRGFPKFDLDRFIGDYANLGVLVFFVISGYLITSLLLQEQENQGSISLGLFYARRFLRLCPAFLAYLGFLVGLTALGWIQLTSVDLTAALTYTVNFRTKVSWYIGHLWSLSVEEQFYLLWPALLAFIGARRARWALILAIIISPVARVFAVYHHLPGALFPCVADSLACGCLLALCGDRLWVLSWYRRMLQWKLALPVAFILILISNWTRSYFLGILLGVSMINILIAIVIHRSLFVSSTFTRLLGTRPAVGIGILSYSLYIWQQFFLNRDSSWAICRFPGNILLAVLFASLSYGLVERPFNRLRRKLRRD